MTIEEVEHLIYENYHKQIGFSKENDYYSVKCQKI